MLRKLKHEKLSSKIYATASAKRRGIDRTSRSQLCKKLTKTYRLFGGLGSLLNRLSVFKFVGTFFSEPTKLANLKCSVKQI
ncbi:hypothetical protein HPSSW140_0784 [Glaesserella parasuis SW140]|nr:hypothetical protein HPSSW140_0784 [Glaesserella parasuis SW140]